MESSGKIRDSYNTGVILRQTSKVIGGISGYMGGTIENCYNVGNVLGEQYVGSIFGINRSNKSYGKAINVYYLKGTGNGYGQIHFESSSTIIEKTLDEMQQSAQSLGDAFTDDIKNEDGTWKYNNGYPILKWQLGDE